MYGDLENKKGFTIAELLVAISLFVVVLGIVVGGFTQGIRSQRSIAALISVNNNMSLVLEQMAREIRVGRNFCSEVDEVRHICTSPLLLNTPVDVLEFERIREAGLVTVRYEYASNTILRSEGIGTLEPITAPNVRVDNFGFIISDKNTKYNPWRVTIYMTVAPVNVPVGQMTEQIQTTVSARLLPNEDPFFPQ